MSGAVATAVVASAVISGGVALYSADQQKKATKADTAAREAAAKTEAARLAEIEANTKPDELSADSIDFGTEGSTGATGSASDFIVPKQTGGLSSSGRSGLGFAV